MIAEPILTEPEETFDETTQPQIEYPLSSIHDFLAVHGEVVTSTDFDSYFWRNRSDQKENEKAIILGLADDPDRTDKKLIHVINKAMMWTGYTFYMFVPDKFLPVVQLLQKLKDELGYADKFENFLEKSANFLAKVKEPEEITPAATPKHLAAATKLIERSQELFSLEETLEHMQDIKNKGKYTYYFWLSKGGLESIQRTDLENVVTHTNVFTQERYSIHYKAVNLEKLIKAYDSAELAES